MFADSLGHLRPVPPAIQHFVLSDYEALVADTNVICLIVTLVARCFYGVVSNHER